MGYRQIKKPAIMITGAAGFIGSYLVDRFLGAGLNVIDVDNYNLHGANIYNLDQAHEFSAFNFVEVKADICDTQKIKDLCRQYGVGWIINCAAETHVCRSIQNVKPFIHSNVEGVASLLDVCKDLRKYNVKLFHLSTDEVYGPWVDNDVPFYPRGYDEQAPLCPQNPYAATKAAAEHMVRAYHNTHEVDFVMVRPVNNFGERQDDEKLIPTIVKNILQNKPIPVFGDGKQKRDWFYVEDTTRVIFQLIWDCENSDKKDQILNNVFNITCKNEKENMEIVKAAINHFGKGVVEHVADRQGHDFCYCLDDKKISHVTNMTHYKKNFEKKLEKTFDWYERKYFQHKGKRNG